MATIKIDNKEYDLDTLSYECKAQLASIQFVEQELVHIKAKTAALQTAKGCYLEALKLALPVIGRIDTDFSIDFKNPSQTRNPPIAKLNTLIQHYKKGQYEPAQSLATNLTQHYPNHPFGWKVLGALLKQSGKLQDSLIVNQKVLEITPNDAEAHSNLGITLKGLGRLREAEQSYKKAISIKPDYAEAYNNLGNTLKDFGRLQEAEQSYKKAILIKPDYAEAYNNFGNTLKDLGRLQEAEQNYRKAIVIKPDLAETHNNLGNTLKDLGRLQEAEESYKKAVGIKPSYAQAYYNLGFVLKEFGRLAEAEACYAEAISIEPDFVKARNELLTCLYLMGKKSLLFDQLAHLIEQNKVNSVVGSLTCRLALRYGEEISNLFCNEPLKHVLLVDLKSRYKFEESFVRNARSILTEDKRLNRRQPLLSNGYQTSGNLFDLESKLTDQIQKTIRLEIERYRFNFERSGEGFLKKWPKEYSLYGWLISMKSGGELQPHIHENGWLSGSIYINVPPKKNVDSGSLVVALGKDSDTTDPSLNSKKIIDVVTGSMVLFPASLMHHTIPFESEEDRIVLAFDVIAKS